MKQRTDLSRRQFLTATGAALLATSLSGCNNAAGQLRVQLLKTSVPPQAIGAFRSSHRVDLKLQIENQIAAIAEQLAAASQAPESESLWWRRWIPGTNSRSSAGDLLVLGDAWLAEAIAEQWLQPLAIADLDAWQQLPARWQTLVRRDRQGNPDPEGEIWAAPYNWGSTLIAYRSDKLAELGWEPRDWEDLWRDELRDRLSLLDRPREVVGLTLKKLGASYNTADLDTVPNLASELQALHAQTKFYSSRDYLQPLILGHTWAAVGWSSDILPLVARYNNIEAIVPSSGTALWTDNWVVPAVKTEALGELERAWMSFYWQPESARLLSRFGSGSSPMLYAIAPEDIPAAIQNDPLRFPDKALLDRCEFLLPLAQETRSQYRNLINQLPSA